MYPDQVLEMVLFIVIMCLWAFYLMLYFSMSMWSRYLPVVTEKYLIVNLWSTAMSTRRTWAKDMMSKAEDARGAALLAVQQMRNIVVASSLLVMGMSQIMGRLLAALTTDAQLTTIARLARRDPMTGPTDSWAPPEVRVAIPFGACLVSLLCFGQAVRLAVHIGFSVRVQGITGGKHEGGVHIDGILMDEEVVVMLQRAEFYFTLGLRFLYLFIGTVFYLMGELHCYLLLLAVGAVSAQNLFIGTLFYLMDEFHCRFSTGTMPSCKAGITPLLVSSLVTLALLAASDILIVPNRKGHKGTRAASLGRPSTSSDSGRGYSVPQHTATLPADPAFA